jgi:hypothetical protein
MIKIILEKNNLPKIAFNFSNCDIFWNTGLERIFLRIEATRLNIALYCWQAGRVACSLFSCSTVEWVEQRPESWRFHFIEMLHSGFSKLSLFLSFALCRESPGVGDEHKKDKCLPQTVSFNMPETLWARIMKMSMPNRERLQCESSESRWERTSVDLTLRTVLGYGLAIYSPQLSFPMMITTCRGSFYWREREGETAPCPICTVLH